MLTKKKKKLYLIRHGESEYNVAKLRETAENGGVVLGVDQSSVMNDPELHDCLLSENGRAQARVRIFSCCKY